MKNTRALTLFLATTMTLGATYTTVPMVASAAETKSSTMADRYQPYLNDVEFKRIDKAFARIPIYSDKLLPEGTTVQLLDANVTKTSKYDNGVSVSLHTEGPYFSEESPSTRFYLHTQQSYTDTFLDSGNTTTVRLLFQYPDGSRDTITSKITIFPDINQLNSVTYPTTRVAPGHTVTVSPSVTSNRTNGTQYTFVQNKHLEKLRQEGWTLDIDSFSGKLKVTTPKASAKADVLVLVNYPDGSSKSVMASFRPESPVKPTPEPQPPAPGNDSAFGSSSS